jgi:uncharacterized protein with NRDE domain
MVIAANRDEFYARPATVPQRVHPGIVAGIDGTHGGTWMGVTGGGFFAGITNQRTVTGPDRSLGSRGKVVLDVLRAGTREKARALLEGLDPASYNSFNLVFGDAEGADIAYARRETATLAFAPLPEGIHVLPNDRLDSPEFVKVARLRDALANAAHTPWPELESQLEALLADHAHPSADQVATPPAGFSRELAAQLQAVCIHTEHYGTRSSSLIALDPGRVARYLFADGPPCRTAFQDMTGLV